MQLHRPLKVAVQPRFTIEGRFLRRSELVSLTTVTYVFVQRQPTASSKVPQPDSTHRSQRSAAPSAFPQLTGWSVPLEAVEAFHW